MTALENNVFDKVGLTGRHSHDDHDGCPQMHSDHSSGLPVHDSDDDDGDSDQKSDQTHRHCDDAYDGAPFCRHAHACICKDNKLNNQGQLSGEQVLNLSNLHAAKLEITSLAITVMSREAEMRFSIIYGETQ